MGWTDPLLPGPGVEPLILVTDSKRSAVVVIEGHSRLTGYMISGVGLTGTVGCYLGVSDQLRAWGCF